MGIELSDALLVPYLRASEDAESQRLITSLISEHAEPVITKIINYKLLNERGGSHSNDRQYALEEIHGEIVVQLLQRLRNLKNGYHDKTINDFRGYVATVTYNACDRYISRKYPQRRRLKNGLRYLLTHRPGLALWKDRHETWLAGLAAWQTSASEDAGVNHTVTPEHARRVQQLRDDPYVFMHQDKDAGASPTTNLHEQKNALALLHQIFKWTGVPVELDELVSVVAAWWNVKEHEVSAATGDAFDEEPLAELADPRASISTEVEHRAHVEHLWQEISQLPPRQRAAVLFNLRDEHGGGVVELWTLTGIAAPHDLARALSISLEEFAKLLPELPLDDNRIAAHLGITRQQVINLRKSARERLARRMKTF